MIDALIALPPHVRERLACAFEIGLLNGAVTTTALRAALGTVDDLESVQVALAGFNELGIVGRAAATWLRSLNKAHGLVPQTDLVWTGPEIQGLHARETRRVFEELLGNFLQTLWVTSYAFFEGPSAFSVLARRMEAVPSARVRLLLNIQRRRGDDSSADALVRKFADRFWRVEWPGSVRPQVYYDPRSLEPDGPGGVLHAKVVVADMETVFVSSANLTEAAWDRNLELGLLVRDGALAKAVAAHLQCLIDLEHLRVMPNT